MEEIHFKHYEYVAVDCDISIFKMLTAGKVNTNMNEHI